MAITTVGVLGVRRYLPGMSKLHFTIAINAPRERVWKILLAQDSYRKWTEPFATGSHFVGSWEKGGRMLFLAPDKAGKMSGMVSRVKDNRPHEFLSIEHLGEVQDGKEDLAVAWAGALENYTLRDQGGRTELLVDMESDSNMLDFLKDAWPKALARIKDLAER